jgi:hypothetical protein
VLCFESVCERISPGEISKDTHGFLTATASTNMLSPTEEFHRHGRNTCCEYEPDSDTKYFVKILQKNSVLLGIVIILPPYPTALSTLWNPQIQSSGSDQHDSNAQFSLFISRKYNLYTSLHDSHSECSYKPTEISLQTSEEQKHEAFTSFIGTNEFVLLLFSFPWLIMKLSALTDLKILYIVLF